MFDMNKKEQQKAASTHSEGSKSDYSRPSPGTGQIHPGQSGQIAVIGRSIRIDGDLKGEEDLRVEGDINGTIQLPNHSLIVGKAGRLKADAYAKSITVDGEMTGDLYGHESVSIRANAKVEGNVVASTVTLEQGARFKGSIDMDPDSVESAMGKKRQGKEATNGSDNGRRGPLAAESPATQAPSKKTSNQAK